MRLRFTAWNSFIVSTFALLSLVTPVANADLAWVGRIVEPAEDQYFFSGQSTNVVWQLNSDSTSDLSGISCNIVLMRRVFGMLGSETDSVVGVLRNDVSILGKPAIVTLPTVRNVTISTPDGSGRYYMSLVSTDGNTPYANSGYIQIYAPTA